MTASVSKWTEGSEAPMEKLHGEELKELIAAVVDFRGDVTLVTKLGEKIDGYIYNCDRGRLDLYPANAKDSLSIHVDLIESIQFTGKDTARGKSWDDWQAKKAHEKAAAMAEPVLND